eukprot:scaffold19162_cov118-Isochrysis_galbana.AAC.8
MAALEPTRLACLARQGNPLSLSHIAHDLYQTHDFRSLSTFSLGDWVRGPLACALCPLSHRSSPVTGQRAKAQLQPQHGTITAAAIPPAPGKQGCT